jgi:hypothetical protein
MGQKDTYQKNLSLDEIASNDLEMVKDAIKNANKYGFGKDKMKALGFVKDCVDKTLKRLGITVNPPATKEAKARYARWLDNEMAMRQIRIEHRNRYRGASAWRCGIYIYQRDELVAFISDILTQRRTELDPISMKAGKETTGYIVITNARLDDTKRIFLMSGVAPGGS